MDKIEYLKMLKEQVEKNSKTMSDTARTIGFAIIGFSIAIHSNTHSAKFTFLFLAFVLSFFIVDFVQYLFMWQASEKLFRSVKSGEMDGSESDEKDKRNKKWAFRLVILKLIFLTISLVMLGFILFKHVLC
jgi:hypothetical protein